MRKIQAPRNRCCSTSCRLSGTVLLLVCFGLGCNAQPRTESDPNGSFLYFVEQHLGARDDDSRPCEWGSVTTAQRKLNGQLQTIGIASGKTVGGVQATAFKLIFTPSGPKGWLCLDRYSTTTGAPDGSGSACGIAQRTCSSGRSERSFQIVPEKRPTRAEVADEAARAFAAVRQGEYQLLTEGVAKALLASGSRGSDANLGTLVDISGSGLDCPDLDRLERAEDKKRERRESAGERYDQFDEQDYLRRKEPLTRACDEKRKAATARLPDVMVVAIGLKSIPRYGYDFKSHEFRLQAISTGSKSGDAGCAGFLDGILAVGWWGYNTGCDPKLVLDSVASPLLRQGSSPGRGSLPTLDLAVPMDEERARRLLPVMEEDSWDEKSPLRLQLAFIRGPVGSTKLSWMKGVVPTSSVTAITGRPIAIRVAGVRGGDYLPWTEVGTRPELELLRGD